MSRRGALALVGGSALGSSRTDRRANHRRHRSPDSLVAAARADADGPDKPVNKTAVAAGIDPVAIGAGWRLTLSGGPVPVVLDRAALAAMPQHTARLRPRLVDGPDLERGPTWPTWPSWPVCHRRSQRGCNRCRRSRTWNRGLRPHHLAGRSGA